MLLLANENFPLASVELLRKAQHDVLAICEYKPGSSDKEIMELASLQERIILTFDRDYGELIYKYKENLPLGIIYLKFIPRYASQPGEYVLQLLENENIELINKFTVCELMRIRQNSLTKEKLLM